MHQPHDQVVSVKGLQQELCLFKKIRLFKTEED